MLDVSVLEVSVLDVSVLEVSVLEVRVLEVRVLEVSVLEVSMLKVSGLVRGEAGGGGGGADTALKTKTPHDNVGNKQMNSQTTWDVMWPWTSHLLSA